MRNLYLSLAHKIADFFAELPQVEAIALGGSLSSGQPDAASDIDLYVYTNVEIALGERRSIVERSGGASETSLGMTFWGPGDEWYDASTGIEVDIVYFEATWMEDQIERVLTRNQASLGYTTCLWHTVQQGLILFDRSGWLGGLQHKSQQAYPEALRQNIIALNYPVLRQVIPSYMKQIEKAVKRRDLVSINHRLAAMLASYFDILFAVNRVLHPGEKRLVEIATACCQRLPVDMAADIEAILQSATSGDERLLERIARLLDHLDPLLGEDRKHGNFGTG